MSFQTGKRNPMCGIHRTGIENPFFGKHHSEKAKKKMSVSSLKDKTAIKYKNKIWLKQKYINEMKTVKEIANIIKVGQTTINRWLKEYNISKRSNSENMKGKYSGENNYFYGKHFYGEQNGFYGKKHSKETKKKMMGINNGSWKDGITPLYKMLRTNDKYLEWKYKIVKRDKICQICGCKKHGLLIVHHIIKVSTILQYYKITTIKEALKCKKLWDINNGITMCKNCHKKAHNKWGKKWAYFSIRSIIYDKTGLLLPNEHIIEGYFTMAYWGNSEENYVLGSI